MGGNPRKRSNRWPSLQPDARCRKRAKRPNAVSSRFLSLADWVSTSYPVPSLVSSELEVDQHNPVEADNNQFHKASADGLG